ncbi:MAG TPA: hypothetical protein VIY49_15775 [Bryobacteraceae bacterium]
MDEILKRKKPGDTMKVLVARRDRIEEINVVVGSKVERSFELTVIDNHTPLQAAILKDWLKNRQTRSTA